MTSRPQIEAQNIIRRMHSQDMDSGGVFTQVTGGQGTGKTSIMLSFVKFTMQNYPDQKVFWSDCYKAPLQSLKAGLENCHFMVKKGSGVTFHDRNNKLAEVTEHINPTYFTVGKNAIGEPDYSDVYKKAKKGKINVVFFGNRHKWMNFIGWLRDCGEWVHVYIEEFAEIAPTNPGGEMYKKMLQFADTLKDVRKCMINVYTNTQTPAEVDWRIRKKYMIRIYLPGSKVEGHGYTRVTQKAVDNLLRHPEGNEAYIDHAGTFGKTRFTDIFNPDHNLHVDARVTSLPEEEDDGKNSS
jgi:hypothetical protein